MYRSLNILVLVVAGVLAVDKDKCEMLVQPQIILNCCKGVITKPFIELEESIKECQHLPHEGNSCERDICIGRKNGHVTSDGKLNMDKIKEYMKENTEMMPARSQAITEGCIDGDISKFGSADTCDITKFLRCAKIQTAKTCPEWLNDGKCKGIKDLQSECQKIYE